MTTTTIGHKEVQVDADGFMTEFEEWNKELGEVMAGNIGITLTDEHWEVVAFLRADFADNGVTPTLRRTATEGPYPTKQLFQMFPKKPARKMAYIAGLQKPIGCI
jgi:TusE/DsrC/DsvC family sulfur relay protein